MSFTALELEYLSSQPLGRLATVADSGVPQNSPVSFTVNEVLGTIDIGGRNMGQSRKFRNVRDHPWVSLIVDDIASYRPWKVRAVEIRGRAVALDGTDPLMTHFSGEIIRIHPERILSWGLDLDRPGIAARTVERRIV